MTEYYQLQCKTCEIIFDKFGATTEAEMLTVPASRETLTALQQACGRQNADAFEFFHADHKGHELVTRKVTGPAAPLYRVNIPAGGAGVLQIDPKFSVAVTQDAEGCRAFQIVNPAGRAIPEDEPLMLFRAQDRNALPMLKFYAFLCAADGCTDYHMASAHARIEAFENFAAQHPERMKQPGSTRGK